MGRLTKRDKNGNAYYIKYGKFLGVHKLADYEDTGLSPEEINKLKADFISLTKETLWKDAINDEWMK